MTNLYASSANHYQHHTIVATPPPRRRIFLKDDDRRNSISRNNGIIFSSLTPPPPPVKKYTILENDNDDNCNCNFNFEFVVPSTLLLPDDFDGEEDSTPKIRLKKRSNGTKLLAVIDSDSPAHAMIETSTSSTSPRVLVQAMEEGKHNNNNNNHNDLYDLRIRNQEALRWLHGTHFVDFSRTSNMAPAVVATATTSMSFLGERVPKHRFPPAA
jgi:hypothetical protein